MKKLYFSLIFLFLAQIFTVKGQINVTLTVNSATTSTTCDDFFSDPDIVWSVNINSTGAAYYESSGSCFLTAPNTQYLSSYNCPIEVPASINVCFEVFENDPIFNPCDIVTDCSVTICQDFNIPAVNDDFDYVLALPGGGNSTGELQFNIANTSLVPVLNNDLICNALDLGTIAYGGTLGDATISAYYNYCATNIGDEDPLIDDSFSNQSGVWFQFSTGPNPSGEILVHGYSDPESLGDDIDLEIAVYESTTGDCLGAMSFLTSEFNNGMLDAYAAIICPAPNNTYFILIDGATTLDPDNLLGIFGLELIDVGVKEGGDLRCEFEDLGTVPEGGSVETPEWTSNFCATSSDDPYLPSFISQHSVWFGFIAPPSGHVLIEGITDTLVDSIGIQIALYRSYNNSCSGLSHFDSEYSVDELNQSLEVSCLKPGEPHYILIDGTGFNSKGIFKVRVTDAGDITPRTMLDTILCAGQVMEIGSSDYTESGTYADSIHLYRACDSIVFSTITFLDPVEVSFVDVVPALGMTNTGQVSTVVTGGTGIYSYAWCNGETGSSVTNLLGGTNCCVTITDDKGCTTEACIDVDIITGVIGFFENDTLLCNGDQNGVLTFSAANGQLPYDFSWGDAAQAFTGSGTIQADNENITLGGDLPAGIYTIIIKDIFSADTIDVEVVEPSILAIDLIQKIDLNCFEVCDGSVEIAITGGTGDYTITWSNGGSNSTVANLCAGTYEVEVVDENDCKVMADFEIIQPLPFEVIPNVQDVSCFEGMDGSISFSFNNGIANSFDWSTGDQSPVLADLAEGFYDVTVTSTNGCEASVSMEVEAPDVPLEVTLDIVQEVGCFGDADAMLQANVTGPSEVIDYTWSSGGSSALESNLVAGSYSVTIRNEKGCNDTAEITIDQPDPLVMQLSSTDITCLDPIDGGSVIVDTIYGGRAPYFLSIDDKFVVGPSTLNGFEEGSYSALLEDASGCVIEENIAIQGPPELLVFLGEDFTVRLGEEVFLTAMDNSDNELDLTWGPVDTINTETYSDFPIISTLYTVVAYDEVTKCTAMDEIFVWVDKTRDFFVPNVFSPNGDGQNESFYPFGGKSINNITSFQVFGRNGMLVFEKSDIMPNNPHDGWDGTFDGKILNAGVFVYKMEINFKDGVTEVFHGDITLIK